MLYQPLYLITLILQHPQPLTHINGGMMLSTTTLKFRNADNDAWISFATFDMTNDTKVNLVDSAIDVVNDTSPQLGGDLDV